MLIQNSARRAFVTLWSPRSPVTSSQADAFQCNSRKRACLSRLLLAQCRQYPHVGLAIRESIAVKLAARVHHHALERGSARRRRRIQAADGALEHLCRTYWY